MIIKQVFLKILVIFFFSSCSLKEINKPSPQINKIKLNEKFRINLPENHSNGNIWQLSDDYDANILQKTNSVWHGNENGVDFNFNTLAKGQTTLTFIARKYSDTTDVKHFIVQIMPK